MIAVSSSRSLNTSGSSESRNTGAGGYPSDDAPTAPFLSPFSLLSRPTFPPEAPSEESWTRFAQEADDALSWAPNPCPGLRFSDDEGFILETRGTTSQIPAGPREACRKETQQELWRRQTVHKNSIAAKLREAGMTEEAQKLECCHSRYVVAVCGDCGTVQKFPNRCDQGYCPECQPSLALERERQVGWWTAVIKQPKHVVLTLRNIPELTPGHLAEAKKYLARLRRTAFTTKSTVWWYDKETGIYSRLKSWRTADSTGWTVKSSPWRGGFYSIEITKENAGWHLHFHLLIDADYISQTLLSEAWRRITLGFSYIVKVKDCRREDYLAEVTKYAVKGSQLAKWSPAEIKSFLLSFANARTFGVFGSLYGARTEFAEYIATMKAAKPKCSCGGCNVRYMDENLWMAEQCKPGRLAPARPPPPAPEDPSFPFPLASRFD